MSQIFSDTSNVRVESVDDLMRVLSYRNHSILSMFINTTPTGTKTDPKVKDPAKHQWINERLNSARANLYEGITDAATSLKLSHIYIDMIPDKSIIKIGDELMLVKTASAEDNIYNVTVQRGVHGTTAASHEAKDVVNIERLWQEGEDTGNYDKDGGYPDYNVCQIFRTDVSLTGSAIATKTHNGELSLNVQITQKIPKLFQQMENALLNPNKPISDGNKTRIMAGMPYFIQKYMKFDNVGNAFSLSTLSDDVMRLADNGVDTNNLLLVGGSRVIASINQNKAAIVRENMKIRQLDFNLSTLILPGTSTVKLAPLTNAIAPDEYYLFDKDSVKFKFFRALKKEQLAKTGDSDKTMVVSEATAEFHNWKEGAALRRTKVS